jgi:hypothetical protein
MTSLLFYLTLAAILASGIWVVIDSHKNKITSGKGQYTTNNGALAWGLGCLLLWLIVFPWYLRNRHRQLTERGEGNRTKPASMVGLGLWAAVILAIVLPFTGIIRMSTSELAGIVKTNIQQTYAKNPQTANLVVDSLELVHKGGNDYDGILKFHSGAEHATLPVDVTFDGAQMTWKPHQ